MQSGGTSSGCIIGLGLILTISLSPVLCSSNTVNFRVYEGDSLSIGYYQLVYWRGTADFPSRLNVIQASGSDKILLESWLLNESRHSLRRYDQAIFNLTLLSEGVDEAGCFYAVGRLTADWDLADVVDAGWLDLHSTGGTASLSLTVQNPASQAFLFEFEPSSISEELDMAIYSAGLEVVGSWHAASLEAIPLSLSLTPSQQAASGLYPLLLKIEGQLDVPISAPVSHISGVQSILDLSLHLEQDSTRAELTVAYPRKAAEAGETIEFEADLKNQLDSATAFLASVLLPEGIAEGSSLIMGGQSTSMVVLQPDEQTKVRLILETSPTAYAGTYRLPLLIEFANSQVSYVFSLDITGDHEAYLPEIQVSSTELIVDAGEQIRYPITIENSGKVEDDFLLILQGPPEWDGTFITQTGGRVTTITLEPGQKEDLNLEIDPPSRFTGRRTLVLKAVSSGSKSSQIALQLEILPPELPILSTPCSEKKVAPGETVWFDLLLHNPGPGELEIAPEAQPPSGSPLETELSVDGETGTRFHINAGNTAKITVTAEIDANARAQLLKWTVSIPYSSPWIEDDALMLGLTLEIMAPEEAVEISTAYPRMTVEAGQQVEFEANLRNQLMAERDFRFGFDLPDQIIEDASLTLNSMPAQTVTIEPGAAAMVKLSIETAAGAAAGLYDLMLEASWMGSDGKEAATRLPLELDITTDEPLHGVEVSTRITRQAISAGQEACFVFSLTNTGKLEDEYELELSLPDGWDSSLRIGNSLATSTMLSPSEKKDLTVCVIPPSHESGTHTISLAATASSGQSRGKDELLLDVAQSQQPDLSCFYPEKTSETGESLQFDLDLSNPADQPVEFWLEVVPAIAIPAEFEIRVDGEKATHFILDGGSKSRISLVLETDTNASAGEYDLEMVASYSYYGEQVPDSSNVSTHLKMILEKTTAEYVLEAYADYPSQAVVAGEQAKFTLSLKNEGKMEDTYLLSTNASASWNARFSVGDSVVRVIQLEPGQTARPTLSVTTPLLERGEAGIAVTIESEATGEIETVPVQLTMDPTPDLEIVVGNLYLESKAGHETSVEIAVENPGNTVVTNVQFSLVTPEDWGAEYSPLKITEITPGGRETIKLDLIPPSTTPRGDYLVSVGAQSDEIETEDIALRVSVERGSATGYTSLLIILIIIGGLVVFFRKFGRR